MKADLLQRNLDHAQSKLQQEREKIETKKFAELSENFTAIISVESKQRGRDLRMFLGLIATAQIILFCGFLWLFPKSEKKTEIKIFWTKDLAGWVPDGTVIWGEDTQGKKTTFIGIRPTTKQKPKKKEE